MCQFFFERCIMKLRMNIYYTGLIENMSKVHVQKILFNWLKAKAWKEDSVPEMEGSWSSKRK